MTALPHDLSPTAIFGRFSRLSQLYRASGEEELARRFVIEELNRSGARTVVDDFGNVIASVDASPGREHASAAIIQSHLDMVCVTGKDSSFDFRNGKIPLQLVGDFVSSAADSSLGADCGIGVCAALRLTDADAIHGRLILVFTVQEEIGLIGAKHLDCRLLGGDDVAYLINLDSEDVNELVLGCAGGVRGYIDMPIEFEPLSAAESRDNCLLTLQISGLRGGHSGVNIHEPRANAIKLLVRALQQISTKCNIRLVAIDGGAADNAIPANAAAVLAVSVECRAALADSITTTAQELQLSLTDSEPGFTLNTVRATGGTADLRVLNRASHEKIIALLTDLPHGVINWSDALPGQPQTSSNLARVTISETSIRVATSSRSFDAADLTLVRRRICDVAVRYGATLDEPGGGYPAWVPEFNSHLVQVAKSVYTRIHNTPPRLTVVHAGVEVGTIMARRPGLEAISFGPTICDPHSVTERCSVSSVRKFEAYLLSLLDELSRP